MKSTTTMDRTTSQDVLANERRVTRRQVDKIKRTFPFMLLPPELRKNVYEFSLDLTTIEKVMDRCFKNVLAAPRGTRPKKIRIRKTTPKVFLLNKQIYHEASYILQKKHVTFHHGLLTVESFTQLIPEGILRRIESLEISDAGHPMVEKQYLPTSWNGYMDLMKELGKTLATGHKLKQLTIDFKHYRLKEHMTLCHASDYNCGFRDQMSAALKVLGNIRGVGKVTLFGLNEAEAAALKKRMESKGTSFLNLPLEIRNKVYSYIGDTTDPSECSRALLSSLATWVDKKEVFPFPARRAPTVLTINKQIAEEVKEYMYKKPLHLIFPSDSNLDQQDKIPSMLGFIARGVLKKVSNINIQMNSWEWIYNIDDRFVEALAKSKNLKKLRFYFKDTMKNEFVANPEHSYPDSKVVGSFKRLTAVRGLDQVVFEGDLPLVFTDALAKIMTSKPDVLATDLPRLKAITATGEIVDVNDRDNELITRDE